MKQVVIGNEKLTRNSDKDLQEQEVVSLLRNMQ